jgi:2-C-methyl-D-erythritol 2,4-cyclodiphosphate synthase
MRFKSGIGFDAHKFEFGRELILGGVSIDSPFGLLGHSDADVLCHAIIDALAGVSLGTDIGCLFPDTNTTYKGAKSTILLSKTIEMIKEKDITIINIDSIIIAQEPKLSPYITTMRKTLANIIHLDTDNVTIKATTTEYMGFTGRNEGIAAVSTVLICSR